jgi:hypothetical protein
MHKKTAGPKRLPFENLSFLLHPAELSPPTPPTVSSLNSGLPFSILLGQAGRTLARNNGAVTQNRMPPMRSGQGEFEGEQNAAAGAMLHPASDAYFEPAQATKAEGYSMGD